MGTTIIGSSPTVGAANATMWTAYSAFGLTTILLLIISVALVFIVLALYATYKWDASEVK